ncbi:MAG TPA: DUF262 domain-containing HNH endonuclease family protein [Bacillota bacterium]|nr:DUF262 domain-containing HNH endonuclease family protein [Bacillota bacterium]
MKHINSDARVTRELLSSRYEVQYYQREYSWQTKQIQELIDDLINAFYENYEEGHTQRDVRDYGGYFLGPVILTMKGSIIDGQQRLSTITLLLIYLNHLQQNIPVQSNIDSLIFSEQFGEKTFIIDVEERNDCLESLYHHNNYEIQETDKESVINLANRYKDIEKFFPDMEEDIIPVFIEWLKERVTFVEIVTSTEQDAHKVFVAMNDRGLRLSPVEMLKGYLLSEIKDNSVRNQMNDLWKDKILELKEVENDGDADFIKNWLRAQYAETQRGRKKGARNLDYEDIGDALHKWVREKSRMIGLNNSIDFEKFIGEKFIKYADIYIKLKKYANKFHEEFAHVYYNAHRNFTLQYQLILAAIDPEDDQETVHKKIKIVSRFIDQYIAIRVFNFRSMNYSTVLYTVFNLTKDIRRKPVDELITTVKDYLQNMDISIEAVDHFYLNQYTKRFIFHKLTRMTTFVEREIGLNSHFEDYVDRNQRNNYDIEHILPNDYTQEKMDGWFESYEQFIDYRESFGALVLLPKDKNRSLQDMPYSDKVRKYDSENILARSLNEECYKNNPSFLRFIEEYGLDFRSLDKFGPEEIDERQQLYKEISKILWNPENIDKNL